jgi:hypothetical protein
VATHDKPKGTTTTLTQIEKYRRWRGIGKRRQRINTRKIWYSRNRQYRIAQSANRIDHEPMWGHLPWFIRQTKSFAQEPFYFILVIAQLPTIVEVFQNRLDTT